MQQPQTASSFQDQLLGLIIGAALTLVATLVVQTTVTPWVQARTRRRERWESALSDLQSLLDDEFARVVPRFRSAAPLERMWRGMKGDPEFDQQRVREKLEEATAAR